MQPETGAGILRWAGILSGLTLVVIGFDLSGSPALGLVLALLGVVMILLVALSGRGRPLRGGHGSLGRCAEEEPVAPSVTPRDAGRRM